MQQVTIVAEMADGTTIVEHAAAFAPFVALALAFRRDSECVRLTWHATELAALAELAPDELRAAGGWPRRPLPDQVA